MVCLKCMWHSLFLNTYGIYITIQIFSQLDIYVNTINLCRHMMKQYLISCSTFHLESWICHFILTVLSPIDLHGWRVRKMLAEQKETAISREKIVKVLEELQAQAEVALCFVGVKNWGYASLVFTFVSSFSQFWSKKS